MEPRFDSLRGDPRFAGLLERMNLTETHLSSTSENYRETGERRSLAAIVFTDIVNFTKLAQTDEALALYLLKEQETLLRTVFARHGGREVKTIGDSFMIEFASALDATKCAIDIQESVKKVNESRDDPRKQVFLRIGIHVGDVVHRGNDIFGDAVNIASRIQPLAPVGGICVSQQVYDQIWNKIVDRKIIELGRQNLKNVEAPIALFSLQV